MSEPWYSLLDFKYNSLNNIVSRASIPDYSPWFSGHFPGEPIVPGIAELSIVFDVIKKLYQETGSRIKITSIKRVRYRFPVKPNEILDIKTSKNDNESDTFKFEITTANGAACSGLITFEKI
jgi:3-hydroxymyristoyl/3-hydroxydecanoyl-(acyl carrier protein) dehydratase